jgi:hypothetical protein
LPFSDESELPAHSPFTIGNKVFFGGSRPPKIRFSRQKQFTFGGNSPFSMVFGHQKYLAENKAYFQRFPLKIKPLSVIYFGC